jgi:hypothetical protein
VANRPVRYVANPDFPYGLIIVVSQTDGKVTIQGCSGKRHVVALME